MNLVLYAVVGMAALFDARIAPAPAVWEQEFTVQAGQSDRQVAGRVVQLLGLSLATPVHDFAIGHDAGGRLVLDFYHANGRHKVTVLASPARLHVEQTRASLWKYFDTLHVTTAALHSGDWRMQLWAWWNEFTMWCLGAMAVSGVWLWISRRRNGPRSSTAAVHRYTALAAVHRYTALAAVAILAVYEISAVQMAHRAWLKPGPVLGALARIHRMRGIGLAPPLGVALLTLAVTGLCLWWNSRRERRVGVFLLGVGIFVSGGLIFWMRTL